jgi:enterochelin esterase-like enzyme
MRRVLYFALSTAVLAGGACLAQTGKASNDSRAAVGQHTAPTLLAAVQQTPAAEQQAPGRGAPQGANPGAARGGGFGGQITLGPDDKPAFPDPPAGFNVQRDNIPHGQLTVVQYDSKTLGTRRQIRVYTPPGYSASRKYPTIYLLHGMGWNDLEWTQVRHADIVIDNLIADGKIPPMVMVFPNGDSSMTAAAIAAAGGGAWMNGGAGPAAGPDARGGGPARGAAPGGAPGAAPGAAPGGAPGAARGAGPGAGAGGRAGGRGGMASMDSWLTPFENDLLKDIIPYVDAHYSVYSDRDHRALAGLSMGGGQTLNIGLAHPETFAYVGGFSSAPDTKNPPDLVPDPSVPKKLKLIWLGCGNKDGLIRISQGVHAYLKEKGVPHVWHVDGNAHDTPEWQNNLYLFSQRLFK